MFKLSREPAVLLALFASLVSLLAMFIFHWTDEQQSLLNAAAIALAGFITAWLVKTDPIAPAALGLVQAVLAVAVGFGLHLAPAGQTVLLTLTSTLIAAFVRSQVEAPIPVQQSASPLASA